MGGVLGFVKIGRRGLRLSRGRTTQNISDKVYRCSVILGEKIVRNSW